MTLIGGGAVCEIENTPYTIQDIQRNEILGKLCQYRQCGPRAASVAYWVLTYYKKQQSVFHIKNSMQKMQPVFRRKKAYKKLQAVFRITNRV